MDSKNQCRLCGKMRNSTNLVLIDEELREIILYHCRISIEVNDEDCQVPNKLCFDCKFTITNFSKFCEEAKEIQNKFLVSFQEVKVEIEELPTIHFEFDENKEVELYIDEPKVELTETTNENLINDIDASNETDKSENSDYVEEGSLDSDSDFKANNYYKKKKKRVKSHRRVRVKRRKITKKDGSKDDENTLFLDVPEEMRNSDGTVKDDYIYNFDGKKWNDLRLECIECQQLVAGPVELRNHHSKYHSIETQFKCLECNTHSNDSHSTLAYYQFLNHYFDHRELLKFCCVS